MAVTINGTTGILAPDIGIDGTTLVVDEVNNRIGIATSSPNAKLQIVTDSGARALTVTAPTLGPYITFETGGTAFADIGSEAGLVGSGSNTDMLTLNARGARALSFRTNSEERLHIASGGSVGINKSSPSSHAKLDVVGTSYWPILVKTTSTNGGGVAIKNKDDVTSLYVGSGGSSWLTGSAITDGLIRAQNDLIFASNANNERLRITSAGNVALTDGTLSVTRSDDLDWAGNFTCTGTRVYGVTINTPNNSNSNSVAFKVKDNGVNTVVIEPTGTATFSDSVNVGGDSSDLTASGKNVSFVGAGPIVSNRASSSNTAISVRLNGVDKTLLKSDGSASFATGAVAISASGAITSNRTSGTNDCWNGKLNGSVTSTINADGLVTLGSASNSTNNNGLYLGGQNGSLNIYTTRYNTDCFQVLNTTGSGSNIAIKFEGNGSAWFTGSLGIGGSGTSNTMDEYEEGTYTPKMYAGTGTTEPAYSWRYGQYVRIGEVVHVWGALGINGSMPSCSQAYMGNLPYNQVFDSNNFFHYTQLNGYTWASGYGDSGSDTRLFLQTANTYSDKVLIVNGSAKNHINQTMIGTNQRFTFYLSYVVG